MTCCCKFLAIIQSFINWAQTPVLVSLCSRSKDTDRSQNSRYIQSHRSPRRKLKPTRKNKTHSYQIGPQYVFLCKKRTYFVDIMRFYLTLLVFPFERYRVSINVLIVRQTQVWSFFPSYAGESWRVKGSRCQNSGRFTIFVSKILKHLKAWDADE